VWTETLAFHGEALQPGGETLREHAETFARDSPELRGVRYNVGMPRPSVFVSYSHKDEKWKKLLLPQLETLAQIGLLDVWEDRRIDAGDTWYPEIQDAMEKAGAAICLISANYLSSSFIHKEEVPFFLKQREEKDLLLLPVLISACPWERIDWLKPIQMLPRDGKPVEELSAAKRNRVFAAVAEQVAAAFDKSRSADSKVLLEMTRGSKAAFDVLEAALDSVSDVVLESALPSPALAVAPPPPQPEKIDITRLPVTGAELFGRAEELRWLDELWESGKVRIATLVAWGGVGKSTLVNKWLERMERDGFRGARKVFGWTFYSQGTGERVSSADFFISEALRFFGDPEPDLGSPWSKGERLAELIGREKNLLVLDGLEPLQSSVEGGRIQDLGLTALLTRLAQDDGLSGLCVITTREPVPDLNEFPEMAASKNLELISPEAGRALLRVRGVRGSDAELEQLTRDFGGHALAVNLLASYLKTIPGHPASAAAEIPDLAVEDQRGRHPRRVLEAFAQRFGHGPELELLLLLGLFDRPAAAGALMALRALPAIPGLTDHLADLSEANWVRLVTKLREARLLAEEDRYEPDALDGHPIVREHFGEMLSKESHEAWQEGNRRLYEYYKGFAEPYPGTPEGLAPLFAAVAYGCRAGRYQEALKEVYWERIQRKAEFFSGNGLGLWGANLQAIAYFLDPATRQPMAVLDPSFQAFVLSEVGFSTQAQGQLQVSLQATKRAAEKWLSLGNKETAAQMFGDNLSQIYEVLGDLLQAKAAAEQGLGMLQGSGPNQAQLFAKAALGRFLHLMGDQDQAMDAFREAEGLQHALSPENLFLYSMSGFDYCELLLDLGHWQEVERRAQHTIQIALRLKRLRDVALDSISLGKAHLLAAKADGPHHLAIARDHMDESLEGLRRAGELDKLPHGLLARAEVGRVLGDLAHSRTDLQEVLRLTIRCGMRLYETDAHLGFARLHLAAGDRDQARASLDRAKRMVSDLGYHRRDRDVAEIEAALASSPS
jgi:tetratricopeptide (TPR) repeat protein